MFCCFKPYYIVRAIIAASMLLVLTGQLSSSNAAQLTEVTDFGPNPTNLKMFLYVPDNIVARPRVLVGVHWCHGTAQAFFTGKSYYKTCADKNKYLLICPNANSNDSCFDVHSQETLTHDGGGDALGIASMVRYVIDNYDADPTRVYAAGVSSGAMMCNVLAGSYPDLFSAVSASAGVPFGCFGGGTGYWNDSCAKGLVVKTGEEWKQLVEEAYPGYDGPRPRMQLWHGDKDDVLNFRNFGSEILQWTNVLGVGPDPTTTEENTPVSKYTRMRYTDENGTVMIEAIKGADQGHNVTTPEKEVLRFLGLDQAPTPVVFSQRNNVPANETSFNIKSSPQGFRMSVSSIPGYMVIRLFHLDGREIIAVPGFYCSDGKREVLLPETGRRMTSPTIAIITVEVNGVLMERQRTVFLFP